jgi:hypothetical protein
MRPADKFGVLLICGLAVLLLGVGGAAVLCRYLTITDLSLIVCLGAVLIFAHQPRPAPPSIRNTFAHGAARVADESEAYQAAAKRGAPRPLDQMEFKD